MVEKLEVDFLAADILRNPHPTLARMREIAPIYHVQHMELGSYPWLVTRYSDSIKLLNDERFTKDDARIPRNGALDRELTPDEMMMAAAGAINRHMLTLDPPDHTRLRALIHKAFTPNMIRALEVRIQEITDGLIDNMQAKGQVDFIREFAFPLPVTVIAELLGIPQRRSGSSSANGRARSSWAARTGRTWKRSASRRSNLSCTSTSSSTRAANSRRMT